MTTSTSGPAADDPILDDERLSEMFAALASTTRRQMLQRLASGEATVNELAEPFDLSLPAVSKHVKVLEHAGLITQGRRAQYRPCSINPDALRIVASWTEYYRRLWDDRLGRMDDYLATLSPVTDDDHHDRNNDLEQPT